MIRLLSLIAILGLAASASAANQRQPLFEIAQRAVQGIDGKDWGAVRSSTWPDGYLIQHRRGNKPLKRHWNEVPFSGGGVLVEHRFSRPKIIIESRRSTISVEYVFRLNYADRVVDGIETPVQCGAGTYQFDLRRRRGEWRVLNLTDVVHRSGHASRATGCPQ